MLPGAFCATGAFHVSFWKLAWLLASWISEFLLGWVLPSLEPQHAQTPPSASDSGISLSLTCDTHLPAGRHVTGPCETAVPACVTLDPPPSLKHGTWPQAGARGSYFERVADVTAVTLHTTPAFLLEL